MWETLYSRRLVKMKQKRKIKKILTEKDRADLVVHKITSGLSTTTEDQQIFVNNKEYIEQRLHEIFDERCKT